jgi:hypothetical protein
MVGPTILLVTLAVATTPVAATASVPEAAAPVVRQERPFAVWVEPQLTALSLGSGRADLFGSDVGVLPLGIELGRQIAGRGFLSVALARFPAQNIARNEVMVAGRYYLGEQRLAPYVAAAVGWMSELIDDTGGREETHRFVVAGAGAELALPSGFSVIGDILLGPDFVDDERDPGHETTHLSGWLRVGLGYRF